MYYLMSPIFLIALHKSLVFGHSLCIATILLSSVFRGYAMIVYNLPVTQLGWVEPKIFTGNFMEVFTSQLLL